MIATEPQEKIEGRLREEFGRVAVVVPSYNHAKFIETTLRSIMKQTLPPAQLLVIDDGSTDDSPRIIERVLRDCSFPCELIARENRGLCATLNEGLAKTSGEFFAYLGSDDLWLPEFLAARVAMLSVRPQAALGYGHAFLIDEQNQIVDCTRDWASYADGNARTMLLRETIAPMSPTVLYRRSILEKHSWHEHEKLEDYDLYLRLSMDGEFAFDPQVLSAWRGHELNASRDFVWMIDARLAAQKRVADQIGLSKDELESVQRGLRFAGAEDLLRLGDKAAARKLLRGNWSGSPSFAATTRVIARIVTPYSVIKRRRRQKQERATARYGSIEMEIPSPPGRGLG
jgi:alpha-1,3-rhamnosyltransferase